MCCAWSVRSTHGSMMSPCETGLGWAGPWGSLHLHSGTIALLGPQGLRQGGGDSHFSDYSLLQASFPGEGASWDRRRSQDCRELEDAAWALLGSNQLLSQLEVIRSPNIFSMELIRMFPLPGYWIQSLWPQLLEEVQKWPLLVLTFRKTRSKKDSIQKSVGSREAANAPHSLELISPYKISLINGCYVFVTAVCQAPR